MIRITLKSKDELTTLIKSSTLLTELFEDLDIPGYDSSYPYQLPMSDSLNQEDMDLYYSIIVKLEKAIGLSNKASTVLELSRYFGSRQLLVTAEPYVSSQNPAYFWFGISLNEKIFDKLRTECSHVKGVEIGYRSSIPIDSLTLKEFMKRFVMIREKKIPITRSWFSPVVTYRMAEHFTLVYNEPFISTESLTIRINIGDPWETMSAPNNTQLWINEFKAYFPDLNIRLSARGMASYTNNTLYIIISTKDKGLCAGASITEFLRTTFKGSQSFEWSLLPGLSRGRIGVSIDIIFNKDQSVRSYTYEEFIKVLYE